MHTTLVTFLLILAFSATAFAKDGRDRALPDEYECPGCGGWEQYRQDQAYESEQLRKREWDELEQRQDDMLREQRRQTELLQEQNDLLRNMNDTRSLRTLD